MIIQNSELLKKKINEWKKEGKKIVFTNGCFDILHKGHVTYLEKAKSFGDILIVGINTDSSVKKLKGKNRPIMPLDSRSLVLASVRFVDLVVPFDDINPIRLIEEIKPNVHVKGGDYIAEDLPEYKIVKEIGGQVKIIPFVSGYSVTSIIERIIKSYEKK